MIKRLVKQFKTWVSQKSKDLTLWWFSPEKGLVVVLANFVGTLLMTSEIGFFIIVYVILLFAQFILWSIAKQNAWFKK